MSSTFIIRDKKNKKVDNEWSIYKDISKLLTHYLSIKLIKFNHTTGLITSQLYVKSHTWYLAE
jgi:hypothetical protein